jgi:hypothetical protein
MIEIFLNIAFDEWITNLNIFNFYRVKAQPRQPVIINMSKIFMGMLIRVPQI